jgi:signal transduction histidine kinase
MRLASIPPLFTALAYFAIGIFVLRHRVRNKNALGYSFWLFSTVYWQLGWFTAFSLRDPTWIPLLIRLNYSGIVFIPIAFYHLMVTFLDARRDVRWLKAAYAGGAFFAVACWIDHWMVNGFYSYRWGFYARAGTIHPLYLLFLTILIWRTLYLLFQKYPTKDSTGPDETQQKLLRWAFICYLPASFDFCINYGVPCYPIGFIFTLFSLALVSYAIVKHHLFDIRLILRKTLIYSTLTLVLSAIYVSMLVLLARALETWRATPTVYSSALAAATIAVLLDPLRSWIQEKVDRYFPRESLNRTLLREATSSFVHEIKHPLSNISMPAQLALSDIDRLESGKTLSPGILGDLRKRLYFILEETHDAAAKMEALRELLIDEAPSRKPIEVGSLLRNAIANEEKRLKKNNIDIQLAIPEKLPPVLGNAQQLEIAFTNIIRNAAEAMQRHPTDQPSLRCEIHRRSNALEILILDSGPGISASDREHLFDPWFSTKGSQGMGIGLYLTREIIQRHGGTIEVSAIEGSETCFKLVLPAS